MASTCHSRMTNKCACVRKGMDVQRQQSYSRRTASSMKKSFRSTMLELVPAIRSSSPNDWCVHKLVETAYVLIRLRNTKASTCFPPIFAPTPTDRSLVRSKCKCSRRSGATTWRVTKHFDTYTRPIPEEPYEKDHYVAPGGSCHMLDIGPGLWQWEELL